MGIDKRLHDVEVALGLAEDAGVQEELSESFGDVLLHNLYGIHIKNKNDALSENNPHICIGWSALGDLTSINSKEKLSELYENIWPEKKKMSKAQDVGQIWRFLKEAKIGDYVILAEPRVIHLGKITSDYFYDNSEREEQDADYVNNRKVT